MKSIAIPDEHNPILTIEVKDLFDPENPSLEQALERIKEEVTSEVFDVTEEKGRKQIASLAHKVARTKTAIDGAGKDYVSGLKAQAKKIDNIRKHAREYLDDVKAKVRAPLTEWEDQEEARQEEIAGLFERMLSLGCTLSEDGMTPLTSAQLKANIANLERMEVDIRYGERMTEAKLVKADIIGRVSVQAEAMAALEEQRRQELIEREKRQEQERIAREKAIAERARERERQESIRREAEAAKIAERQRIDAEQKAREREEMLKQQMERERKAAEQKAQWIKEESERKQKESEEAARIAKERELEYKRREHARMEAEEKERQKREVEEAKRQEDMKASYDRRRTEAAESMQSILDVGDPYISGDRILNEIIKGNVPHVRFND